ncbi:MAG: phosphoribosylformylglycinamidine cyclo-ligase [Dehalococcoidia bacterium]
MPSIEAERGMQPAYRAAGVDTEKQDLALASLIQRLRNTWTHRDHVGLDFGHFANFVDLGGTGVAISTDSVGTKAIVAQLMGDYYAVGIDCVAINVNDVLCLGAEPQSLVDYIAVQRIDSAMLDGIGRGLEEGARQANITIVGGEIAQLPEVLRGEEEGTGFDLVGTCIGMLDPDAAITGSRIEPGDVIVGLPSSGIHCNGLTLARKVFGITRDENKEQKKRRLAEHFPELGSTLGEELLKPTRIYVAEVMGMMKEGVDLRGLAHISGDGFLNLPRLEADVGYFIDALPQPHPIFHLIQAHGAVPDEEMYSVFNMGIGFCVVVPQRDAERAVGIAKSNGTEASRIGYITDDPKRTVILHPVKDGPGLQGWRKKGFEGIR